jgi:Xaa-Pro aminopeptidase
MGSEGVGVTGAVLKSCGAERLARVRAALEARGLAALLVPSSDPHVSEYLPARWQGRQWLSGFTGSVGSVAVTLQQAALFVDSRYWLQAEAELAGSGIALVRAATSSGPDAMQWLTAQLRAGSTVAVDGQVLSIGAARRLAQGLGRAGIRLDSGADVLGSVWPERPALPAAALFEHLPPHAASSRADKLAAVRRAMREARASHHLISALDEIAWLLNLRGADVPYNPVFVSHLLLDAQRGRLFIAPGKIDAALADRLADDGIVLAPYEAAAAALQALAAPAQLLVDPERATCALLDAVPQAVERVEAVNPGSLLKSRKTAAEAQHIRAAMAQDGAALCAFYAWLEAALAEPGHGLTETMLHRELCAARARRPGFMGRASTPSPVFASTRPCRTTRPRRRPSWRSAATACC